MHRAAGDTRQTVEIPEPPARVARDASFKELPLKNCLKELGR
jgi:hypothetical protein